MNGKIPQSFIDDLLDRVDIAEIIGSRVNLKRGGRNYKGLCPFHQEKTPSFSVNPDKQFYYCFGCGAGGNAVSFMMEYERLEFPAAIEQLAHSAGLEVPREESGRPDTRKQTEPLYALLAQCAQWYQQQLRSHPQAPTAIDYLKGRGLTGITAKRFGIGFAPPGWSGLLDAMGDTEAQRTLLEQAGMLVNREDGKCYDRFRERIQFPIRDVRGRVVAFGGRVLGDGTPKYLNSPETPVFSKSRELYGLYEARQANRHLRQLLIVEGYMDVVVLAQHGIDFAAATLGTAVGRAHLERVFRYTSQLTFCFDGDQAGRAAAGRALEAALPLMLDGRQARFLFLAEGEDPDSLVSKIGREAFLQQLDKSQPIADFLFDTVARGIDLSSIDGRARLSKLSQPLIDTVPDGVFKQLLLQALSRLTGLDQTTMDAVNRERPEPAGDTPVESLAPHRSEKADVRPARPKPAFRPPASNRDSVEKTPIRSALAILLFYPELARLAPDAAELNGLNSAEGELLAEMLELLKREPDIRTHTLVGSWLNTDKHAWATQLLGLEDLLEDEDKAQQEFVDALKRIRWELETSQLENELHELEALTSRSDAQKLRYRELLSALKSKKF